MSLWSVTALSGCAGARTPAKRAGRHALHPARDAVMTQHLRLARGMQRMPPGSLGRSASPCAATQRSDTPQRHPRSPAPLLGRRRPPLSSRARQLLRRRPGCMSGAVGSAEMAGCPAGGFAADRHDAHGQGQSSKGQVRLVVVAQTHACHVPVVASPTPSRAGQSGPNVGSRDLPSLDGANTRPGRRSRPCGAAHRVPGTAAPVPGVGVGEWSGFEKRQSPIGS